MKRILILVCFLASVFCKHNASAQGLLDRFKQKVKDKVKKAADNNTNNDSTSGQAGGKSSTVSYRGGNQGAA